MFVSKHTYLIINSHTVKVPQGMCQSTPSETMIFQGIPINPAVSSEVVGNRGINRQLSAGTFTVSTV